MSLQDRFRSVIVIPKLSASGAERVALNSAHMLLKRGHRVDLILLENIIQLPVPDKLVVHCLTENRNIWKTLAGTGDRLLANRLQKLIGKLQHNNQPVDLVLSHLPAADRIVSLSGLDNVWYCIHTHYSVEIAGFMQRGRPVRAWRKQRQYRRCYRHKQLVTVSDGVQADLREQLKIQAHCFRTIYNPFDFDNIRRLATQACARLPDTDFILHAGAFRPVKRHDILLQAFSQLQHPIKLVLLTNNHPELNALINHFGLNGSVIVVGHQENPYPYMHKAKLTILSSEREGLPTTIIESLICGTPVVSTDCPSGPKEILAGNLAQWLVPVSDPAALASKIDEALDSEIHIPEQILEKFTEDRVYEQYCQLLFT